MALPSKALSAPGDIVTVAGGGVGDGSPATAAFLYHANDVAIDGDGNLYIADTGNQRIRKVYAATGTIITVAGSGIRGYAGDNGPATAASLKDPSGVAVDVAGNLYIADCANHRIRKVAAGTGIITTVAGTGTPGYSGDNGPATAAALNYARGVALDGAGNLYIADELNQRIRKVAAATGIITTIAGNGIPGYAGDNGAATAASLNVPVGMAVDSDSNLYIADFANNRIRKVAAGTGIITTVAGNGTQGYSGDGGAATAASLYSPQGMALDSAGNLYIVDEMNARVRKVAATTGIITTVAGNGTHGYSGDNGPATAASLNSPISIAIDSAGNFHIGDGGNNRIRKVSANAGIITTVAGNGAAGYADGAGGGGYSADGGPATSGTLYQPHSVALDNSGNLYIADSSNHRIRKVATGTGIITTIAGTGTAGYAGDGGPATAASLNYPIGIAADGGGNVYVADWYNQRIRKVAAGTGVITTVAGDGSQGFAGDNGPAPSARLNYPWGVATDSAGNFYIADTGNQRIRKVAAGTGIITTIAGNGEAKFLYDNCPATEAQLNNPEGVALDSDGNLYIADYNNQRIRKVAADTGIISTVAGNGAAGYGGDNDLAINAKLNYPVGVALDGAGNLYIADHSNYRVRKVASGTGIITTVAGNGTGLFGGDYGPATAAGLNYPMDVALDGAGNLYIADFYNSRIREVLGSSTPVVIPSPDGGTFMYAPEVTLTASMPATIYYTTDGSDPATSSSRGSFATSGQLTLSNTTTLTYYAVALDGKSSDLSTRVYTIIRPSYQLSVILAGTGSGSVHSIPAGIACSTGPQGSCTAPFDQGGEVALTATPSAGSTFGGWAGACAGTGPCSLTMSSARSVTATFTAAPKVKVGAKGFSTLQSAYDDYGTTSGSAIKLLEGSLAGILTAGRGIAVRLEGGYNAAYDTLVNKTFISGPLRIRSGTVRVKGVSLK